MTSISLMKWKKKILEGASQLPPSEAEKKERKKRKRNTQRGASSKNKAQETKHYNKL